MKNILFSSPIGKSLLSENESNERLKVFKFGVNKNSHMKSEIYSSINCCTNYEGQFHENVQMLLGPTFRHEFRFM